MARSDERIQQLLQKVKNAPQTNFTWAEILTPDNILRAVIAVKLEELCDALEALRPDNLAR